MKHVTPAEYEAALAKDDFPVMARYLTQKTVDMIAVILEQKKIGELKGLHAGVDEIVKMVKK